MFDPRHCGLYFTDTHIKTAHNQRAAQPFQSTWALLHQRKPLDLLELVQWHGLLYRFADDPDAGARAVAILQDDDLSASPEADYIESVASLMTQAQCFEMVRDHPAFTQQHNWLDTFTNTVNALNQHPHDRLHVEYLWRNALNLVAAIVLEDASRFEQALDVFKACIRNDVHPEGYMRKAAVGEKGKSLYRMLLSAQALILTAEAANHAGENLWAFSERGVSALTPTPYLLYYYYYPEKWRWDTESKGDALPEEGQSTLELGAVQALYKRHAGLWEMAQRQSPSTDRQTLLDDLRPVYDLWGGGLVTLTHGLAAKTKRRFGLFG